VVVCGAPLLAPSVVLEQERKVVSVLFCDVVGFTAMSEPAGAGSGHKTRV